MEPRKPKPRKTEREKRINELWPKVLRPVLAYSMKHDATLCDAHVAEEFWRDRFTEWASGVKREHAASTELESNWLSPTDYIDRVKAASDALEKLKRVAPQQFIISGQRLRGIHGHDIPPRAARAIESAEIQARAQHLASTAELLRQMLEDARSAPRLSGRASRLNPDHQAIARILELVAETFRGWKSEPGMTVEWRGHLVEYIWLKAGLKSAEHDIDQIGSDHEQGVQHTQSKNGPKLRKTLKKQIAAIEDNWIQALQGSQTTL